MARSVKKLFHRLAQVKDLADPDILIRKTSAELQCCSIFDGSSFGARVRPSYSLEGDWQAGAFAPWLVTPLAARPALKKASSIARIARIPVIRFKRFVWSSAFDAKADFASLQRYMNLDAL